MSEQREIKVGDWVELTTMDKHESDNFIDWKQEDNLLMNTKYQVTNLTQYDDIGTIGVELKGCFYSVPITHLALCSPPLIDQLKELVKEWEESIPDETTTDYMTGYFDCQRISINRLTALIEANE